MNASAPWPWWLASLVLGTVPVAFWIALRRPLGVSGALARFAFLRDEIARDRAEARGPMEEATSRRRSSPPRPRRSGRTRSGRALLRRSPVSAHPAPTVGIRGGPDHTASQVGRPPRRDVAPGAR